MKKISVTLALLLAACGESAKGPPEANNTTTVDSRPVRAAEPAKSVAYTGSNRDRFEAFALANLPAHCIPEGYKQGQRYDENGSNLLGWTDDLDTDDGEAFTVGIVDMRCFELLLPRLVKATEKGQTDLFGRVVREVTSFPDADGGPTFMIYFEPPAPASK